MLLPASGTVLELSSIGSELAVTSACVQSESVCTSMHTPSTFCLPVGHLHPPEPSFPKPGMQMTRKYALESAVHVSEPGSSQFSFIFLHDGSEHVNLGRVKKDRNEKDKGMSADRVHG